MKRKPSNSEENVTLRVSLRTGGLGIRVISRNDARNIAMATA